MDRPEAFSHFAGFGTGRTAAEYHYSQGMTRTQFGMSPGWAVFADKSDANLPTLLSAINWFTQTVLSLTGINVKYAVDGSGNIYSSVATSGAWALVYAPGDSSHGNGLKFDQKGRLLYATDRYLGMFDPTQVNYTTGTVQVTNGSAAVVGSGTTFTGAMVGKQFQIAGDTAFYRVATFTDATHITLAATYAGTGGSGKTYTIYTAWTDQWKDFGSSFVTADFRPIETNEDQVVIGNINQLALLASDDSFNANAFNLPAGFMIRCVRASRTGIMIAANLNNRGVEVLWDGTAPRSITPWFWYNSSIRSIEVNDAGWIIATARELYQTNGYTRTPLLPELPDQVVTGTQSILSALVPQGLALINNYLMFIGSNITDFNRRKDGVYILNVTTKTFEFAPVANNVTYGVTGGAVFIDVDNNINLSYLTAIPSHSFIGHLSNATPASALFITNRLGVGPTKKIADGFALQMAPGLKETGLYPITFTVSAKLYTGKRPLWQRAFTRGISTSANILKILPNFAQPEVAQVGDEITVTQGTNAGLVRHITAITDPGGVSEEWTLDSALPSNTEASVFIAVSPFRLIKKYTLTNLTEMREFYFDITQKLTGNDFMIKILFENLGSVIQLDVRGGLFLFDDKSAQKG